MCLAHDRTQKNMREWLSWWSTTLPRSGPRVRVPSRALFISPVNLLYVEFTGFFIIFFILIDCKYPYKVTLFKYKIPLNYIEITDRQMLMCDKVTHKKLIDSNLLFRKISRNLLSKMIQYNSKKIFF